MSIARKLGLWMGVIYMLGALGLAVLPGEYLPALQLSFSLLALVFMVCGLGLIGLSTSKILWGEPSARPSQLFPEAQNRKTIAWPPHWRPQLKLKGGLS